MIKILIEGLKEGVEDKVNNPFWGSIILTWLTWNWKVWYITIFISENKIGNKIDYINNMYNYFNFYNLFPLLGYIFNWLIIPLFLSWLIIFIINPKISIKFLEKHRENKIKENLSKIKEIIAENEKIIAEEDLEKNKTNKRNNEYNLLKNNYKDLMKTLESFIYIYNGQISNSRGRQINIESERILDSNGLIDDTHGSSYGGKIYKITEKGKYFLKKYSLNE